MSNYAEEFREKIIPKQELQLLAERINETANHSYLLNTLCIEDQIKEIKNEYSDYNEERQKNEHSRSCFRTLFNEKYKNIPLNIESTRGEKLTLEFSEIELKSLHSAYNLVFEDKKSNKTFKFYTSKKGIEFYTAQFEKVLKGNPFLEINSAKKLEEMFSYHKS